MNVLQRAVSTARMQIEEAEATARIRLAYTSILVTNAQALFAVLEDRKEAKNNLETALKDKDTDPSMLYRGLLVQLNGVFESFVRSLCAVILEKKSSDAGRYAAIEKAIRQEYTYKSARILTHVKSGAIYGIRYDFEALQSSWAKCILNSEDYTIQSDVFTLLMGNCTSSRLTDLFRSLSLAGPFDDVLGKHPGLRTCAKERSSRRVAKFAKTTLDEHIALRNDIAHGNLTRAVSRTEFESCSTFYRALIDAISDKVSKELHFV